MDFKVSGSWAGSRNDFDTFKEVVLDKIGKNFFNDDVEVVIYNHHHPDVPVDEDVFKKMFSPYISTDKEKNKKKLFIVNYGWHSAKDTVNIHSFFDNMELCNSDIAKFNAESAMDGEYAHKNKNGNVISTFVKINGIDTIFFMWDAIHLASENAVREWSNELLGFAINCFDGDIFLPKFAEMHNEGGDKRISGKKFVSIKSRATEIVGKENIDSVISEMIDRAPVKEIVLFLNQIINSDNESRIRSRGNHSFVTKEQVRDWLHLWAERKWPYYVMFGREFEITSPCQFKLREGKDDILVNSMLADFKRQFIKYAPILDTISVREYLSNTISCGNHSQLEKYKPIRSGIKLSKYLSEFFEDSEFDISLSKFIQNKEFNSIAHISINPMDYMTSSVTKHDWKSCHNPMDGCCGAGPFSYMFDEGSLVAFMATDREYIYDLDGKGKPFAWNSKSWRQIIYGSYDDNAFVFCREYPQEYKNDVVTAQIRDMVEKRVSSFCDIPDIWCVKKNGARSTPDIYQNVPGSAHYDDVGARDTVLVRSKMNMNLSHPINVGSKVPCPITKKMLDYKSYPKQLIFAQEAI